MSRINRRHRLPQVSLYTTMVMQVQRVVLVYLCQIQHIRHWRGRGRIEENRVRVLYQAILQQPRMAVRRAGPASLPTCSVPPRLLRIRPHPYPPSPTHPRGRTMYCLRMTTSALQVAPPHNHRERYRVSFRACMLLRSEQVRQVACTVSPRRVRIPNTSACFQKRVL